MYRMLLVGLSISIFLAVTMGRSLVLNSDKSGGIQLTRTDGKNVAVGADGDMKRTGDSTNGFNRLLVGKIDTDVPLKTNNGPGYENSTFTPEYMLELYNKLSKSPPLAQTSNIIRSFKNIAQQERWFLSTNISDRNGNIDHDTSKDRVHSLVFDISSLDLKESINHAELRLYTLIKRDQHSYYGVSRLVTIYKIVELNGSGSNKLTKHKYITSKYVHSMKDDWESFDVTAAVKLSVQQHSKTEVLEVRIKSFLSQTEKDSLDITASSNDQKQPLLVVYSNDENHRHQQEVERHELLSHEKEMSSANHIGTSSQLYDDYGEPGGSSQYASHSRSKRSRMRAKGPCRRREMYVNFADIELNHFIAPRGYQAYRCVGRCYTPLSEHLTPSKHALIQAYMSIRYPQIAKPCCVPTKLDPISVLYFEGGAVTFKYKYEGMVVAECGCR